MICIRESLREPLDRITCAHELGHAVLHPLLNFMFMETCTQLEVEKYEREADYFCACLLLYPEVKDFCNHCEGCTIQQLACHTGLPETLIEMWLRKEDDDISNSFNVNL